MEAKDRVTIDRIVQNSTQFTRSVKLDNAGNSEELLFRPLQHTDLDALQRFFESLSEATRKFATYSSYDLQCAQEFCDEINQDDVLRMVATVASGKIIGVFEFSLSLEEFDRNRYHKYGIELNSESDVQFAPCIADEYQNRNLGTKLLHLMIDLAKQLGKKRIILWAGVLIDNQQAIRFYEKNNFQIFQEKYIAQDGYECYDGILSLI